MATKDVEADEAYFLESERAYPRPSSLTLVLVLLQRSNWMRTATMGSSTMKWPSILGTMRCHDLATPSTLVAIPTPLSGCAPVLLSTSEHGAITLRCPDRVDLCAELVVMLSLRSWPSSLMRISSQRWRVSSAK